MTVGILVPSGIAGWTGLEIASPTRRTVLAYHREFLDNPSKHGLRIEKFTASDGTPCLVCTPETAGKLGTRGTLIRQQLVERSLALPQTGTVTGTLVLTHGRKGRKEDYLPIAERLCASGFRCIIPDLPAHGDHPATIATYGVSEANLPARILDEASRRFSFEKHPAGLLGMSMGGSVAVHAASLPDAPWRALAVISSFDSFPVVITDQAVRHAGATLGPLWANITDHVYQMKTGISIESIQPRNHAAAITIPTLITHGTADRVVPMNSGKRLYDAIPSTVSKRWIEVPGADHDNVLVTDYPVYAEIASWMIQHVVER